ncbi:MAG: hypothetical protein R3C56_21620 [Pirellulaceae bacterium]
MTELPRVRIGRRVVRCREFRRQNFYRCGQHAWRTLAAEALGVTRPRLNASLVIDPGAIIKLEARALKLCSVPTSLLRVLMLNQSCLPALDDTVGAGGTFDTNNNGAATGPRRAIGEASTLGRLQPKRRLCVWLTAAVSPSSIALSGVQYN